MAKLYNLARMTTATTGTGTITLGAAVSGYLTFALAGVANGDVIDYAIKDGSNSEHGTGTYTSTGTTLTRTVTSSTNANAAISLSGTAEVFISPRAQTLNDGSLLTTGTVVDARLSSNVPLKNAANSYSALNTYGGGLTVSAGQLNSGVQNIFSYATAASGNHQFTTNVGSGGSVISPSTTGMPVWFISNDTGPAGYSLHRSGAYAMNHGLNTNNYLYWGGWSDGTNVYRAALGAGGDLILSYGIGLNVAGVGSPSQAGDIRGFSTAKAWVRFNGNGGVTVAASFQVSSVVRNSGGNYTVNFTTALADGNGCPLITMNTNDPSTRYGSLPQYQSITASAVNFTTTSIGASSFSVATGDNALICFAIFR